mmetsp:Transcript_123475/g.360588  ORF Transcript_123475/g.360588 Transcript_123475/m.360588 type:complete len:215 (+) Transcript_123475:359-1003(+)
MARERPWQCRRVPSDWQGARTGKVRRSCCGSQQQRSPRLSAYVAIDAYGAPPLHKRSGKGLPDHQGYLCWRLQNCHRRGPRQDRFFPRCLRHQPPCCPLPDACGQTGSQARANTWPNDAACRVVLAPAPESTTSSRIPSRCLDCACMCVGLLVRALLPLAATPAAGSVLHFHGLPVGSALPRAGCGTVPGHTHHSRRQSRALALHHLLPGLHRS